MCGPSPRGRGTLSLPDAGLSHEQRHPRAGGERSSALHGAAGAGGPSPRGRGTRLRYPGAQPIRRAIPARAGNASSGRSRTCAPAGHPRAGGERRAIRSPAGGMSGPSPRGRGTQYGGRAMSAPIRAIPARAGNAPAASTTAPGSPGHPRAGGERRYRRRGLRRDCGPSPRGRGTRLFTVSGHRPVRAIPARAGNAPCRRRRGGPVPGHPRAGGERRRSTGFALLSTGPSPRGRGTPRLVLIDGRFERAIPARAGNARSSARTSSMPAGHPRAGGERRRRRSAISVSSGPSPRGRGTLAAQPRRRLPRRAIPARAGNARYRRPPRRSAPGHPRAGGERHQAQGDLK